MRDTMISDHITQRDAVSSSCQQPHRQTAHCDVTVAESQRRQTNVTTAADRHASGEDAFTVIQSTDILALMPKCDDIHAVIKSDRHTTKAASSVNVDESMSAGLP